MQSVIYTERGYSIYFLICLCQTHFSQKYICICILIGQYIVCIRLSTSSGILEVISFAKGTAIVLCIV